MLKLKKYTKRSPYWYVRGTFKGNAIFESAGTDNRSQAEKYRQRREKQLYDFYYLGVSPPATFADAVSVYINKGGEVRYAAPLLEHFKEKLISEIGQVEIDEAARMLLPTAKASTINRQLISPYITIVRAAIKAELPGATLRPIERRKEAKTSIKPASDDHIMALLPYCKPGLQALLVLMTDTGLRTGEAMRVRPSDVQGGFIMIGKTKNGEPRMVPVPYGWTYPEGGFGHNNSQGVGKAIKAASYKAGLPYHDGHELGRHAFAARILKDGHSIKIVKDAGNWKKLAVVDGHYGHLEQSHVHGIVSEISEKRAKSVQSKQPNQQTGDK